MSSSKQENPQPNREKLEIVVASCLVEGDLASVTGARRSRSGAFGISLAIESLVLGLLVVVPLFNTIAQPHLRPMLPVQISFFHQRPQANQDQRVTANFPGHVPGILDPYQHITAIPSVRDFTHVAGPEQLTDLDAPDIPGAIPITESAGPQLMREPQPIAPAPQIERHPLKLSQGVLEAQLVSRMEPRYPPIAVMTKTEGTVLLHAFISREGRITSLEVVSGNPLLIHAALEAVQQWRYRPTMLSGEPVEVETTIAVVFRLHN